MKTPLNIALYVGLWPHNIGNAFLGLGAEAIIRQAFPDAAVFRTGCAGHWMFSHGQDHIKKNFFGYPKIKKAPDYIHNSLELAQVADVDLVVVPGMCLAKEFIATSGKTLLYLAQRKIPVLFLGAGPDLYTADETQMNNEFLVKLHKFALLARDHETFVNFQPFCPLIEEGIDCAFFLPEIYMPPRLRIKPFDVENFDQAKNLHNKPEMNHQNKTVIRTHHNAWGPVERLFLKEENTLISDMPYDYLALYKNADVVYTDRIHACLAALVYGNKARLYSTSPRANLFKSVGADTVLQQVSSLDMSILQPLKRQQISKVHKLVAALLN